MRPLAVALIAAVLTSLLGGAVLSNEAARPEVLGASVVRPAASVPGSDGCLRCHQGIEDMHPGFPLSCVDCHGGDGEAREKSRAHVAPRTQSRDDERVAPIDQDLAYVRFVNPMDLRVADKACGECHGDLVEHLMLSLHGTTAAHLSDGFFENGLQKDKDSRYSVFPVVASRGVEGNTLERLVQPPRFDPSDEEGALASHFPDLVRKECMQCHLWSQGRAVRGRVGFDGEYRGAGCAACHVPYRVDGFSESADPTALRSEPGHPRVHSLVAAPPTETCTTCHYGDASIGLHFRGLSQLPPGAPGGPEIPGTTDALLHRSFFVNDPEVTPPDVHHASGLHCVDCHTLNGVMGDGRLVSKMEEATDITCQACHGSFTERTSMVTERGTKLKHLFERDGSIWMKSKVTGAEHRIKQAVDVLDERHEDYNPEAARAMTGAHGEVACYTCHGGWNVNFLGFHFYRNEALTQLDLLSGERTPGRVTTQEKVFTTWKSFYAGLDEQGRVAPYLTGFSTMGTVDDADGNRVLDQEFPVTANGLSGLTMIHHQLHSTRPTARSCAECHRASETWGMGSGNFRLGRQLVFAADRRGIEVIAFDRENPQSSVPLAKIVLPDVVDVAVQADPLHGFARHLFVSEGQRGVHVVDVGDPRAPERVAFHMTVSPRALALAGTHLYVADGVGGLKVFDVSDPDELELVAAVPTIDAHDVEVRWPYAYVADGPGGLVVVDVSVPVKPRVVGGLDLEGGGRGAIDLDVLFQYSRPTVDRKGRPSDERTPARRLVAVCDEEAGPILVDATEPTHLETIGTRKRRAGAAERRRENASYLGVTLRSHVDLATSQGGNKTRERDYMYFAEERLNGNGQTAAYLRTVDVTDPTALEQVAVLRVGDTSEMVEVGEWYNPPFLQTIAFVPGEDGVFLADVGNSSEPSVLGTIASLREAYLLRAERFPLDKMLDEDGRKLKDVSHPESRWLLKGEIGDILDVDGEALGTIGPYAQESIAAASSARRLFARADADRSGLLVAEERSKVGGDAVDRDGDGRVTLAELANFAEETGRTVLLPRAIDLGPEGRVAPDGDLARLLDVVDPFDFDKKKDGRLDRTETERAFFAALDLDGSGRLDVHELSRHPGPLRELRFGDRAGLSRFSKLDRSGGGSIGPREFDLRDEDWAALDPNGDGFCQLDPTETRIRRSRDQVMPEREWPLTRRFPVFDLPPGSKAASILAGLDRDGDGQLSKREMRKRPRLMAQLDVDRSSTIEPDELARAEELLLRWGVEGAPDDFFARWDLDRDGEVADDEVAPVVQTLLRRRPRRR
ncbi:MAG: hypothetical protein AAGI22_17035 [Planctomycetota bacterium]